MDINEDDVSSVWVDQEIVKLGHFCNYMCYSFCFVCICLFTLLLFISS